jgi:tRNA(Ile)-lysidine synthase
VNLDWLEEQGADAQLLFFAATAFSKEQPKLVGVAVSGGSDSMAVLHLMARAAVHCGWQVRAVTVDHRLRPEAAEEAAFAGRVCAGLGVPHDVLVWDHGTVAGNLQDQARRARYRLIGDWARASGIGHVMLGHTADDQAETFLMGLAREAGLDGLSGMRAARAEGGVVFARPFLTVTRADLRGYLVRQGVSWIEDPSNADEAYARVRARRALKALAPLGITAGRIGKAVENLDLARSALETVTRQAAQVVVREEAGSLILDGAGYLALAYEVQRRLMIAALKWVSGADYAPRAKALERVQRAVIAGKDAVLAGCRVRVSGAQVRIVREPKAVQGLAVPTDQIWDGRWTLQGPHAPGLEVRALGAGLTGCKNWRATGVSRDTALVSPAVWQGETLIAAPLAGFPNGWTATLAAGFGLFAVSH